MPAERTRGRKRDDGQGIQLTWTTPVDPSGTQNFAFAPTVTPGTFYDPPSPEDPPTESMLFPPTPDSPTSPRRAGHTKKKPDNHIPRPPNAFILFRSSFIKNQHVSSDVETNHSTLSKIIGLTWQNLPHEERQIWHSKAKIALEDHKRKFPQYAFRPAHAKGKAPEKRKVREVGPKDLKRCKKIAELLVEGLKGTELDAAIAEFDRHHVPEIVTRFEAPITARTYRRSSSAPVPDTEHSKPSFLPSSPQVHKPRASSSRPESPGSPSHCWTPPPPSEPDTDGSSDWSCDSPSSPSAPSTIYTLDTLPDPNPSFDFSTFSFAPTSQTPMYHFDSHSIPPLEQYETYDVFSQASSPSVPCTPSNDIFSPMPLTLDTSFFGNYTDSPSPLSSMPSTPHPSQNFCDPLLESGGIMTPLDNFDTSYAYFSDIPPYHDSISSMCASMDDPALTVPSYCSTTGSDFSYYERSGIASFNNGLSPPFIPNFTM
ncbi:hypothetical protein EW026_g2373 [Hermanssonia centrifuga]|uniref:HMG box domain-containing protein n=1 Tax=Hermanssonia centrifuga TaxID=98765 RepID=A0A4S4KQJ0_9APHY|nr:hypothetical protein EW026_g2373 [Hermanssonia centrifuga]